MPSPLPKARLEEMSSCTRSTCGTIPSIHVLGHSGCQTSTLVLLHPSPKCPAGSMELAWCSPEVPKGHACPLPSKSSPWGLWSRQVPLCSHSTLKMSTKPSSSKGCGRSTGRLMHSSCQNILPAIHPVNMPSLSFAWKGICYGILIHGLCSRC